MATEESPSVPAEPPLSDPPAPHMSDLVDSWENINRNLSKVLEDESIPSAEARSETTNESSSALEPTAEDPVVVIRQRTQQLDTADDSVVSTPDFSSKAMFGDLAKSLSRYVIPEKSPGSCSPPPGLGPLPSPTPNGGAVLGTLQQTQQQKPPPPVVVCDKNTTVYGGRSGSIASMTNASMLRHPERCFNNGKNAKVTGSNSSHKFDSPLSRSRHSIASINELTQNVTMDFGIFPINEHTSNENSLPSVQTDHLMHLLSGRLCVLEDTSSSIDKKLDAYEYHCRKKLEDCRQQLRKRIDELVEAYGKEIGMVVTTRRKSLQRLERNAEEHLAATNKLLTQAKLKLSRMKITNEELHALNDRLLDSLVKTKKIQRETNEFNCWLDFVPKDPLEFDDCLGSLQCSEQQEPPISNDHPVSMRKSSTLNPYAENWEPHPSQSIELPGMQPPPIMRNFSLDDNDFTVNPTQYRRSIGPVNMAPAAPSPQAALLVSCNRRNSWHPMMQSSAAKAAAAVDINCLNDSSQQQQQIAEELLLARNRRSTWATCLASTAAAIKSNQFLNSQQQQQQQQQQHVVFPYKNCIQLLPSAPAHALTMNNRCPQIVSSMDELSGGAAAGGVYMRRKHYSPPINRMSMTQQCKSSLLTLDMQRPSVVDCYGDPPRHLKCIKGLCFMSPNRLLICENGRRTGHKNVLMFSLTGSFLSYINPPGTPFTNPTGICVMQNSANAFACRGSISEEGIDDQKLIVIDGTQLKLVCANTGQMISAYPLVENESDCNGEEPSLAPGKAISPSDLAKETSRNSSELTAFHRQDRFGGLHAVDNLVYVCNRKSPSLKVFDIRASRIVSEWTCPEVQNPNFVYRKNDYIYVSDSASNAVIILTASEGSRVGELKASCNAKNLFNNPCGICDDGENLAVADLYNNRIQLFSKDCLIGSIYSPCIESPFSIAYHSMGVMAISNGRPRTVTLYFSSLI